MCIPVLLVFFSTTYGTYSAGESTYRTRRNRTSKYWSAELPNTHKALACGHAPAAPQPCAPADGSSKVGATVHLCMKITKLCVPEYAKNSAARCWTGSCAALVPRCLYRSAARSCCLSDTRDRVQSARDRQRGAVHARKAGTQTVDSSLNPVARGPPNHAADAGRRPRVQHSSSKLHYEAVLTSGDVARP